MAGRIKLQQSAKGSAAAYYFASVLYEKPSPGGVTKETGNRWLPKVGIIMQGQEIDYRKAKAYLPTTTVYHELSVQIPTTGDGAFKRSTKRLRDIWP